MHDAWTQHSGEAQFLLIDMGRAFARFRPPVDGSDNYSTLIRCLMTNQLLDRIAIASLNYECILEGAAERWGVEVGYGSGGRPANSLVVLKPHGSCNLFPPDSMVKFTRVRMVNTHIYYDGPLEWVYLDDVELRYAAHETMPSAMCLYAPGKHAPVAPSWVEQVRQAWRAVASSADAVAVIGVRPVWEDAHVWDPVIESGADIWYIGDDLSYAALANKVAGQITHLGRTFDEGIGPLCRLVDSFS
jgi:hypothetical protein